MSIAVAIAQAAASGLSELAAVQFGMSLQTVPSYLIGLYAADRWTPHPWVLSLGAWVGLVINCFVEVTQDHDNPTLNGGVTGVPHDCPTCP